jgi:hypothetical protein
LVGGEAPAQQQCSTSCSILYPGCTSMHFGENQLSPLSIGISPLPTVHPSGLQSTPVRPSTRCYARFSLTMGSSSGFGSTRRDIRAIHTRFRCGSACHSLNRPRRVTRRIILQKARRQAVGRPHLALRLHVSNWFQGLFHSPRRGTFHRSLTVLCAIGRCVYLALGGGPPSFTPDITCPALLKRAPEGEGCVRYPAITVYGNAFQAFSRAPLRASCRAAARPGAAYNPERARPAGLTRARFGPTPVRSPLLRGCCLFLGVHEMFQFPRCPPR